MVKIAMFSAQKPAAILHMWIWLFNIELKLLPNFVSNSGFNLINLYLFCILTLLSRIINNQV
jgi:hypothetical protein